MQQNIGSVRFFGFFFFFFFFCRNGAFVPALMHYELDRPMNSPPFVRLSAVRGSTPNSMENKAGGDGPSSGLHVPPRPCFFFSAFPRGRMAPGPKIRTTIRILTAGLIPPTSGSIELLGCPPAAEPALAIKKAPSAWFPD